MTTWLRGIFGRHNGAGAAVPVQSAEELLFHSSEGAEAQEALSPEWLPQDLENWGTTWTEPPKAALNEAPAPARRRESSYAPRPQPAASAASGNKETHPSRPDGHSLSKG